MGFSAIFPNQDAAMRAADGFRALAADYVTVGRATAEAKLGDSLEVGPSSSWSVRPTFVDYMRVFDRYGGTPYNQPPVNLLQRSMEQRERYVYGYQAYITPLDRHYLVDRDSTARMLVEKPAMDAWSLLPRTYSKPVDDFLAQIDGMNFRKHAASAHKLANRDGFAFIYINASGDIRKPIPARAKWHGFEVIRAQQLAWPDPVLMEQSHNPLTLFHGIEYLHFHPVPTGSTNPAGTGGTPIASSSMTAPDPSPQGGMYDVIAVHGSRVIPITPQVDAPTWLGESVLDPIYDDLRNLRDIIHAQRTAQFEANPIVVEVDIDNGFRVAPEDADAVNAELKQFASGTRDSFSPMMGLKMRRLGKTDIDDPQHIIRLLCSRISQATPFTVNMLLASSRGSQQVTDSDYQAYESNLTNNVRRMVCEPILRQLLLMAQRSDMIPRRTDPVVFQWPHIRIVDNKTEELNRKNRSITLHNALISGRLAPPDIMEEFPINTVPIDIDVVLGTRRLDVREDLKLGGALDDPDEGEDLAPDVGADDTPQDQPSKKAKTNDEE